jgi:hypothetical protein
MRQSIIMVSIGVVVAAFAAIAGSTIVANAPKQHAASAASWVGVMDLMKGQKNLPEEAFDAY